MISKDYVMLLILGIIVVLTVVTALETFDKQAESQVDDTSRDSGNIIDCTFSENSEDCRTSTSVEMRYYET